jgi:predicted acylesterase/phospholipase RssA
LPAADVLAGLEGSAELALGLARLIVNRSRNGARRPPELHQSLAVLAVSGDPVARSFARRLAAALTAFGPTQLLEDHPEPAAGDEALQALEDRCRFVIYDIGPAAQAWCRAALDRADEVLFVASARSRGATSSVLEAEVSRRCRGEAPPRRRRGLLPGQAAPPAVGEAGRWLVGREIDNVHHVRAGESDGLAPLARIVAGRAVSVVFGGGAARGFAHLGVLGALEELRVPVDQVGGTSIGAVMAAYLALGMNAEASLAACRQRFRRIIDRTLPVASVARGKRLMASIHAVCGDRDIEDLWLPYFCVSTSLTRSRPVVHRRGSLALAVRASVAIPGVFPPVPYEGELLVDGSLLDNLPVAEMRRLNPTGTVIAVDVAPPGGRPSRASYGYSLSGWRALSDRLRRREGRAPLLANTVLRSMLVASGRDRDRMVEAGLADLYLDLDVRNCSPFDFDAVDRGAAAGYEQALPRLAEWAEDTDRPWEWSVSPN